MKKAFLVLMMISLISTIGVFAGEISLSGEFEYGFIAGGD